MSSSDSAPQVSDLFYFETVVFQVEDVLYRVPRDNFIKHSEIFESMFQLPNSSKEGTCNESPIILQGYKKSDFESLLKLLYSSWRNSPSLGGFEALTHSDWIGVLHMANRWQMLTIRETAIKSVVISSVQPVEKVLLGRDCRVPAWVVQGYSEMICNPKIDLEDFGKVGLESAMKLLWIYKDAIGTSSESKITVAPGQLQCPQCNTSTIGVTVYTSYNHYGGSQSQFHKISSVSCSSCGATVNPVVSAKNMLPQLTFNIIKDKVEKTFETELKSISYDT
ncbi:hypothetical protein FA15DRAFT_669880 [Coprinopsis marcescibilis]|uniref:BTB domain-containing protein n=1 Tax=Coprinopsis marcescibilis TaxID=230819 RepID=A0A5C3KU76_COPMA|nr:hypothetical protein FA15DRAFT_669880 [Coprinopsis marcescibilis]